MLTRSDLRHLMLIGAYRENEVDPAHPLARRLDTLRRSGPIVHEIGAEAGQVRRMVLARGLRLAGAGVTIGIGGALVVTRALKAALFEVSAADPLTFLAVSALLFAVAAAATCAPALRATRVDPMVPLRAE